MGYIEHSGHSVFIPLPLTIFDANCICFVTVGRPGHVDKLPYLQIGGRVMANPKLDWQDVDSSNVKSVAYIKDLETLCVQFLNGGLYSYQGVDEDVYVSLVHADSVGKYLNQAIKGVNPYVKWSSEQELLDSLSKR